MEDVVTLHFQLQYSQHLLVVENMEDYLKFVYR